jgi:hypothetical protein
MHFPDQYYVGKRPGAGLGKKFPLGFATPDGKDSAAKKRKETVVNWAGPKAAFEVIDNIPIEGFRFVVKNVKEQETNSCSCITFVLIVTEQV